MSLNERLASDVKQAMRDKDKFKLTTLRMVQASVKNQEIDLKRPLEDEEIITIVGRELKQRKDSLQEFKNAGRDELIADCEAEIAIISAYLPAQLSEDELKEIVKQTIQEVGASSKAEMGKVMAALMPKVKGKADGKLVNTTVQQLLQ